MAQEDNAFVLPPAFASCLSSFDVEDKAFSWTDVFSALQTAGDHLGSSLSPSEKAACNAEITAFGLMPDARNGPWKSYFGPFMSGEMEDGSPFYTPDVTRAPKGTADYWQTRALVVRNPILKARYADVAWDLSEVMGQTRKNPEMARVATDSYLAAVALYSDSSLKLEAAARAMELALQLRDNPRAVTARQAMLNLHAEAVAARKQWWFVYDRLAANKKSGLSNAEAQRLVHDLERLLLHFSDQDAQKFNPHEVKSLARRLIPHYERQQRPDEVKRLRGTIGKAFEHFGRIGDGLTGSLVLGDAVEAYAEAGMVAEATTARSLLEKKSEEAIEQMVPISSEFEITKEEMDAYLADLVVADPGQTLANIALEFMVRRKGLEEEIAETARQAPLTAMIGRSILVGNRVAGKVGSTEKDPLGRLLQHASQHFQFSGIWLHFALGETITRHGLTADHFMARAQRSVLYPASTVLREGLHAWLDKDYVKAIHVLVPQVEHGLRNIVAQLGKPVTKAQKAVPGVSVAKNMGDMLFDDDVANALGPDMTLHLQAMYTDPRGWNIRNEIAHGLMKAEHMSQSMTEWVVHTILLFGLWGEMSKQSLGQKLEA